MNGRFALSLSYSIKLNYFSKQCNYQSRLIAKTLASSLGSWSISALGWLGTRFYFIRCPKNIIAAFSRQKFIFNFTAFEFTT